MVGRRADGYHLLDSLVAFAALGDRLQVRAAATLHLAISGPFAAGLAAGPENLVWRAARLLDPERGAALALDKQLPVASGIGGGSADAAAALLALNDLWDLGLDDAELARRALALGADVPMCLRGAACWVGGVGEQLAPGPALPPLPVVLVNPGVPLATPDVFRAWRDSGAPFRSAVVRPNAFAHPATLAAWLRGNANDLEAPARFLCPPVDAALGALTAQPRCLLARMSGSGATCFGLFATEFAAAQAAERLRAAQPGWWVAATTLA